MLAINFSAKIQAVASQILQGLENKGSSFNGLHLRMEDDMADAVQDEGGFHAAKQLYETAFKKLNYNSTTLIYVASGIFTDKADGKTSALMTQVCRDTTLDHVHFSNN